MPPCSDAQYEFMKLAHRCLMANCCASSETGSAQNVPHRSELRSSLAILLPERVLTSWRISAEPVLRIVACGSATRRRWWSVPAMVRGPLSARVSFSLSPYLSFARALSLSLSLPLCLSLRVYLRVSLSLCLCVSRSRSLSCSLKSARCDVPFRTGSCGRSGGGPGRLATHP